jgi:hypothetical protein
MTRFALSVTAASLLFACDPPVPVPISEPDAGAPPANTCPAANGVVLNHQNDLLASETWSGDGTVHNIIFGFTIRPGATLTLERCAVVKVKAGAGLSVEGTAAAPSKLVSQGTADGPVLVSGMDSQAWGYWRSLSPDGTMDLSYTTFEGGGAGAPVGSTLLLRGPAPNVMTPMLRANHLTIEGSTGIGLVLERGAAFTADSTEVNVLNGGNATDDAAIMVEPTSAGTIPPGNISGNARDQIRIGGTTLAVPSDLTLHKRVPYHFKFDRVRVSAPGASPTLTLEPGVEVRFDDYLRIGDSTNGVNVFPGKLVAIGTVLEPIVFTSAKVPRVAGDWPGVWLVNAPGSRLENVHIDYAGGSNLASSSNCKPAGTTDDAALLVGWPGTAYIPAASDFANVTISNSTSHGINSMWSTPTFGPELTAGFTFVSVSGCSQTRNRISTGPCGTLTCLVP